MSYRCDTGDDMPGEVVITLLTTGDTLCYCAAHAPEMMQALVDAMTGTAPAEPSATQPETGTGWEGPQALDVYPPGDPRNEPDHPDNQPVQAVTKAPTKRGPRKAVAAKA